MKAHKDLPFGRDRALGGYRLIGQADLRSLVKEDRQFVNCSQGRAPREELVRLACRIYDARQNRSKFFAGESFGEPVWDILLGLYCLPSRREELSISKLPYVAGVPATTGLRWANIMEDHGLIERRKNLADNRRIHVVLSARGEEAMSSYLAALLRSLTPT